MHILSRNMHAIRLPHFISEYLRLYAVGVAIGFFVAAGLFLRRLPGWFRSLRSASWLMAQGTVEHINVSVVSGQALGELAYSYVADGERYSGYLALQFANEQDAWDSVGSLKNQSIFCPVQERQSSPVCNPKGGSALPVYQDPWQSHYEAGQSAPPRNHRLNNLEDDRKHAGSSKLACDKGAC